MKTIVAIVAVAFLASASGYRSLLQVTPQTNYLPVTITASSAPFDIIATPITPVAPYSQRLFQCNVTGDSRFPPYASGTFPLTVKVPAGQRVRVIFANGNLNGATVTQQGEPGVIVQQGGAVIVQQSGSASPIVQTVGSPIVQSKAPPAAMVVQQSATVVQQQPAYSQATVVQQAPSVVQQPSTPTTPATPAATTPAPTTPATTTPAPTPAATTPAPTTPAPTTPAPTTTTPATTTPAPTTTTPATTTPAPTTTGIPPPSTSVNVITQNPPSGRRLLQDRVPGGPNNGLVEYVALASSNTVPGFVVPNTQFGVPYVEFTASAAAAGQTAKFMGVLEVAQVVGGVPLYPFRPNQSLSPECQVNVNFVVA